jgi:hypothetical protein
MKQNIKFHSAEKVLQTMASMRKLIVLYIRDARGTPRGPVIFLGAGRGGAGRGGAGRGGAGLRLERFTGFSGARGITFTGRGGLES